MEIQVVSKSFSIAEGMILVAGCAFSVHYITSNNISWPFWRDLPFAFANWGLVSKYVVYNINGLAHFLKDLAPLVLIQNLTIAALSMRPHRRSSIANGLGRAGNLAVYCGVAVLALVGGFSVIMAIPVYLNNMSMTYGADLHSLAILFDGFFAFVGFSIVSLWVYIAFSQGARIERDWLGVWSLILSLFWIVAAISAATSKSLNFLIP